MSTTPTFTIPNRPLTWLITGCSSGFGLSLTRILLAAGHRVIATSRDPTRTPDLVAEVQAHSSNGSAWHALDVTDREAGPRLVEELYKKEEEKGGAGGGGIDVLVNNAGYAIFGTVETTTEDEERQQMETMYFGPMRLIRAVVPHMRRRRFGVIVNFSSGASLEGAPSMGTYAGCKAGLDGITRVLAKEVAPFNIRALTVVLGTFNTNFDHGGSLGSLPMPEDYEGSLAHNIITAINTGTFVPNGDKDKAMRAVYEIVSGTGAAGKGNESERLVPMGHDMIARFTGAKDQLAHALEVFGETAIGARSDQK